MSNADSFFGGMLSLSYPKPNENGLYTDTSLRGVIRGGLIVDEPKVIPLTDMNGMPLYWDAERTRPKEQLVVVLRCDGSRGGARDERNRANPHDTGERRLFVKGYLTPAIREALSECGSPGLRVGAELYVCWIGEQEPKRRGNAWARVWKARYVPATTGLPQSSARPETPAPTASAPANPWGGPSAPATPAQPAAALPAPATNPWGSQSTPAQPAAAPATPVASPWG